MCVVVLWRITPFDVFSSMMVWLQLGSMMMRRLLIGCPPLLMWSEGDLCRAYDSLADEVAEESACCL
jgi:hypothetical protein